MIARRWTMSAKALASFNLAMVVAVGVVFVLTETSWNRCLAELEQGIVLDRKGSLCRGNLMEGQVGGFLLIALWVLGDLAFAAVWLRRRRSAGIRSAPATWVALGLSVVGFITMLRLGQLSPFPYLFSASGVVAGVTMTSRARAGRRDAPSMAAIAIGCIGVVVGIGLQIIA